jgi:hypothetical protein
MLVRVDHIAVTFLYRSLMNQPISTGKSLKPGGFGVTPERFLDLLQPNKMRLARTRRFAPHRKELLDSILFTYIPNSFDFCNYVSTKDVY